MNRNRADGRRAGKHWVVYTLQMKHVPNKILTKCWIGRFMIRLLQLQATTTCLHNTYSMQFCYLPCACRATTCGAMFIYSCKVPSAHAHVQCLILPLLISKTTIFIRVKQNMKCSTLSLHNILCLCIFQLRCSLFWYRIFAHFELWYLVKHVQKNIKCGYTVQCTFREFRHYISYSYFCTLCDEVAEHYL